MIQVKCDLIGRSPIGFNAPIQSIKQPSEKQDDHEDRTWRERMHTDKEGNVYLLPTALKNCLISTAQYLSETISGKRGATYTKHFKAGVLILDMLYLGVKAADVKGVKVFVPSTGTPGGGKRVWKTFPVLDEGWKLSVVIYIDDPTISPDKMKQYLEHAGVLIGLGAYRRQNGGHQGMFKVVNFKHKKVDMIE